MKIFVTGGSGFIGSRLIERLKADGHQVIALARSSRTSEYVRQLGATPVSGDLGNIVRWKNALLNCDAVVHCAAPVEFWGPWERFESEIVTGTRSLMKAATEAGVPKFIHLSSESVLQDITPIVNVDESHPYPTQPNSLYGIAKMMAEQELLQSETSMSVIILRPAFVWGDNSKIISDLAELARSGSFMWASEGQMPFEAVHVLNLVEAIVLAIQRGAGKQIYFVTDDEESTVRSFFSQVFSAYGVNQPRRSLPTAVIRLAATITESLWSLLAIKGKPPITRFEWAFIGMPRKYSISKIKRDLCRISEM